MESSLYEARVEFCNIVASGSQRLIQLNYPSLLRLVGRRQAQRITVPATLRLRVTASHYSGRETHGQLVDITLQGLSFQSPPLDEPFQKLDRIKTEIIVRKDEVEKILIQGEVAWRHRFRMLEGSEQRVLDRYGLCFHTLNPQQEGKIRYLISIMQKSAEAAGAPAAGENAAAESAEDALDNEA